MIRKQFTIKHHPRYINPKTIHQQKNIKSSDSHRQAGFISAFLGVEGNHGGLDAQAHHAPRDPEDHEGFPPEPVHDQCAEEVGGDAAGDPACGEDQLVACAEAEGFVEGGAVVVDYEDGGGLADEGEYWVGCQKGARKERGDWERGREGVPVPRTTRLR